MKKLGFFLAICLTQWSLWANVFEDFSIRMDALQKAIPSISLAAEATADRLWNNPKAQIEIPYMECSGFCEEMIARAGGLAQIGPIRPYSNDGVVLFAVRDWERFGSRAEYLIRHWKASGKLVIVFASPNGKPKDLGEDFFINNGAEDGSGEKGVVNAVANVTLGWMFCCEYASAFSRKYGKFPAITKSIAPIDSWGLNKANETPDGSIRFFNCPKAIPRGELASVYWYRVQKLLQDMREPVVITSIENAAQIISDRLADGRRVGIAGLGHLILEECKHGIRSPMIGFRLISMRTEALESVLDSGDLLVWLSYAGMNSHWDNYADSIRNAGLDLIASFAQPEIAENTDAYLAYIPQMWALPDAEVAIPVKPGAMAPVSEINRVLLLHLLDDAVCSELQRRNISISIPPNISQRIYDPDRFFAFGNRLSLDTEIAKRIIDEGDMVTTFSADRSSKTPQQLHHVPQKVSRTPSSSPYSHNVKMREGTLVCSNSLWGVLNPTGKISVELKYDLLNHLSSELLLAQTNRSFGLIRFNGDVVQPLAYDMISNIGNGLASFSQGFLFGVMDANSGEILTPPSYNLYPTALSNDLIVGMKGKLCGLFSKTGEEFLPPVFESIKSIRNEEILVKSNGFWKTLSLSPPHNDILPGELYTDLSFLPNGGYKVKCGRLHGELNADLSPRIPVIYDYWNPHPGTGEILLRKNKKWFLATSDGAISPFLGNYEWIDFGDSNQNRHTRTEILEPKFRIKCNGLWGYMDSNEKIVIPCQYSDVCGFAPNGYSKVALEGELRIDVHVFPMLFGAKWGIINRKGEEIVPCKFSTIWNAGTNSWKCISRTRETFMTP